VLREPAERLRTRRGDGDTIVQEPCPDTRSLTVVPPGSGVRLDHQAHRHGLDSSGGQAAADSTAQDLADRVADQAIQNPPGLQGIHEVPSMARGCCTALRMASRVIS
jgi:hypothetical protein